MNNIIAVQVRAKQRGFPNVQICKHFLGICTSAVIRREHIRCIGFSKPSRPAVADIGIRSIQHAVGICNQTCLVEIDLRIQRDLKCTVIWIYKSPHL